MSVLVAAEGRVLDRILETTGPAQGLTRTALQTFNSALSKTSWGQTHQHRVALMDGSDVLASAQRYDLIGMLDRTRARGVAAFLALPHERPPA